jgi:hypothetical protein
VSAATVVNSGFACAPSRAYANAAANCRASSYGDGDGYGYGYGYDHRDSHHAPCRSRDRENARLL